MMKSAMERGCKGRLLFSAILPEQTSKEETKWRKMEKEKDETETQKAPLPLDPYGCTYVNRESRPDLARPFSLVARASASALSLS